jgi:hypothetical protein
MTAAWRITAGANSSLSLLEEPTMRCFFCSVIAIATMAAVALATRTIVADEPQVEELSAAQILDGMSRAYDACKTYQDKGVVKTVFYHEGKKPRTDPKPFTTAFIRPDRFRYEYTATKAGGDTSQYIIWRRGGDVQTWWDIRPGVDKSRSLKMALSTAQGVSGGSSATVAHLLMPGELGRWQSLAREAKRLDDGKLGDVNCYRIELAPIYSQRQISTKGVDPEMVKTAQDAVREKLKSQGARDSDIQQLADALKTVAQRSQTVIPGPQTLWIERKSFLLRQIDEQTTFADFRTETTTSYEPVMDAPVADERLEFNPPK